MFTLIIETYPVTASTAVYTALTVVIVRTEAVSQVDYTVYGRLWTARSPNNETQVPEVDILTDKGLLMCV